MLKEGQYWKDLPNEVLEEAMGSKLNLGGGKTGFYRRLRFDRPSLRLLLIQLCQLPICAIQRKTAH